MRNYRKIIISGLAASVIVSCAPVIAQRGNMLETHQLQQITAGTSTQSDVLQILGSPTTQSTFNNNIWYYIGQETQKRGILDDQVTKERVFSVTFNDEGVVDAIEEVTGDREEVPYAKTKTATHGNDYTFMQQLLGNLGRFNAPQDDKPY